MDSDVFVHIDITFGESYISKRSHLLLRLPNSTCRQQLFQDISLDILFNELKQLLHEAGHKWEES